MKKVSFLVSTYTTPFTRLSMRDGYKKELNCQLKEERLLTDSLEVWFQKKMTDNNWKNGPEFKLITEKLSKSYLLLKRSCSLTFRGAFKYSRKHNALYWYYKYSKDHRSCVEKKKQWIYSSSWPFLWYTFSSRTSATNPLALQSPSQLLTKTVSSWTLFFVMLPQLHVLWNVIIT